MNEIEPALINLVSSNKHISSKLTNLYNGEPSSQPSIPFLSFNYAYHNASSISNSGLKILLTCILTTHINNENTTHILIDQIIETISKASITMNQWYLISITYQNHTSKNIKDITNTILYFNIYLRKKLA